MFSMSLSSALTLLSWVSHSFWWVISKKDVRSMPCNFTISVCLSVHTAVCNNLWTYDGICLKFIMMLGSLFTFAVIFHLGYNQTKVVDDCIWKLHCTEVTEWEGGQFICLCGVNAYEMFLSNVKSPMSDILNTGICLTFRHPESSILGQAFRYSPENAFYIFNQQIYFIIWYLLDHASLI